jgi:hypothetical protein
MGFIFHANPTSVNLNSFLNSSRTNNKQKKKKHQQRNSKKLKVRKKTLTAQSKTILKALGYKLK